MKVDMHYYGTYSLARAAGIKSDAAQIIAYASQYVDNSTARDIDNHKDGGKLIAVPTAHHATDIRNLSRNDQRYIWIPFHFFPGNIGNSFTEKLVCRKNSPLAREMVKHNLKQKNKSYILELVGITSHVYADTFAHYGFSGVSSRRNRVVSDSIKISRVTAGMEKVLNSHLIDFFDKYGDQGGLLKNIRSIISFGAELATGALGHGGVSTFPDLPYLKWSFDYEYPEMTNNKESKRNNQKTFLEYSKNIHAVYKRFVKANPQYADSDSAVKFKDIKPKLIEIFANVANIEERINLWKDAMRNGEIMNGSEEIPNYELTDWDDVQDEFEELARSSDIVNFSLYRFYQAASFHKHYVLRELLPSYGLAVI